MHINHSRSYLSLFFLVAITFFSLIKPHGFGGNILIKVGDNNYFWPLEQIVNGVHRGKKLYVASYDQDANQWTKKRVTAVGFSETNCYCRLLFDDGSLRPLECTPSQLFYRIDDYQWVAAYMLRVGDLLLCDGGQTVEVADITLINKSLKVYTLEVKDTHTFLVTERGIVVHNMLVPVATAIGFSVPFNIGCGGAASLGSLLGPVGIAGGVVVGGVIGYLINACIKNTIAEYELSFKPQAIATFMEANKKGSSDDDRNKVKNNEAQAPGKPTENDGKLKEEKLPKNGSFPFIPPKKKDGKIPKNKNGAYIDDKGNEWKWDNRKNEWDVSNKWGHRNINSDGYETHRGTHPHSSSNTSKSKRNR